MKKLFESHPVGTVFAFALVCLLPLMALRDFSPANELRYLSIADESFSSGHVLTLFNGGAAYADKPPLYFWFIELCKLLFGGHYMLPLALLSFACVFGIACVMDKWALKGADALTRGAAAVMLLSSALMLGMAVYVRMDLLMCLFIVLALYSFWRGKPSLFALFSFLGLFTKGPVGLLLPLLSVLVWLCLRRDWKGIVRWMGWRFFLIVGGLSAIWLGGVYLEGGKEYFDNLVFHQTAGRAVNAFAHKEPFWFYLIVIWGVTAPWCLLTVPSVVISLRRKVLGAASPENSAAASPEGFFAVVSLVAVVMLSLFSSKIALYLLPIFPMLVYGFALLSSRTGLRGWMKWGMGFAAGLFILIGLALFAGFFALGYIDFLSDFAFLRTGMMALVGIAAVWAGISVFCGLGAGWQKGVLTLGVTLLAGLFCLSFKLPEINRISSYGPLCDDILRVESIGAALVPGEAGGLSSSFACLTGESPGQVYTVGLYRPENIDVYLGAGRRGVAVPPDELRNWLSDRIPENATIVLEKSADEAYCSRLSGLLRASGRTPYPSDPLYTIWR